MEPNWVSGCQNWGNRAPGSPLRVHGSSKHDGRRDNGTQIFTSIVWSILYTKKSTNVFALTLHMCDLDCDPFRDPVRDPVRPHYVPLYTQDEARIYNHTTPSTARSITQLHLTVVLYTVRFNIE